MSNKQRAKRSEPQISDSKEEKVEQKYTEPSNQTTINLVIYNESLKQAKLLTNIPYEMKISHLKLEIQTLFTVEPRRQELNLFVDDCGETKRKGFIEDINGETTIADYRKQLDMNEINVAVIDLYVVQSNDQKIKGLMYNEFIHLLNATIGNTQQFPLELCLLIATWIYGALKTNVCLKYGDKIYGAEHGTFGKEVYEYFRVPNGMKLINKYNFKTLHKNLCVGEQEIFLKSSRDIMGGIINVIIICDNNTKKYDRADDFDRYDIITQCMLPLYDKSQNYLPAKYIQLFIKTLTGKTITMQNVNVNDFVITLKKQLQDKEGFHPLIVFLAMIYI